VGQGELGGAAREPELDVERAGATVDPDRAGDHADAAGVGYQLDALGHQLAEPGDVRRQRPRADHDASQPAGRGAIGARGVTGVTGVTGTWAARAAHQAARQAREIRVAVAVDLERDVRTGDADLVGAQRAGQQRVERDRRLDRIGDHQVAERDVGQPDGAGQVGVDPADPRRHAAGRAGVLGERRGLRRDPRRGGHRHADRAHRGGDKDASIAARSHQ